MTYIFVFGIAIIGVLLVNFLVKQNRKAKENARKTRERLQNRIKRHDNQ